MKNLIVGDSVIYKGKCLFNLLGKRGEIVSYLHQVCGQQLVQVQFEGMVYPSDVYLSNLEKVDELFRVEK